MKKNIYTMVLVAIISSLVTIICYWMINQNKKPASFNILPSNNPPVEIKAIKYKPQIFVIRATGIINELISNQTLEYQRIYEFTTGLNDHIKDNENTYKGVKLSDIINRIGIKDYQKVIIKASSGDSAEYQKNEIDDNLFLLFEKNGITYSETEPISFIDLNISDCYVINDVERVEFR